MYAPGLQYDPISCICTWQQAESCTAAPRLGGQLLILAAGTADTRVAKEALQVLQVVALKSPLFSSPEQQQQHRIGGEKQDSLFLFCFVLFCLVLVTRKE